MEPDGSSPERGGWAARSDFLLVPADEPALPADWETLGRAERLSRLQDRHAGLDADIRARLADLTVDYLSGVGSWMVRSPAALTPATLRSRLAGLPVQVADDESFVAL